MCPSLKGSLCMSTSCMVGAVGIEPTTFGLKARNRATQETTAAYKEQKNQRNMRAALDRFRLALYPVHEQLHGQFYDSSPASSFGWLSAGAGLLRAVNWRRTA